MTMLNILLQLPNPGINQYEYEYFLYLPIGIWLFGILVLFIFLLKKYTFGQWTEHEPNPYKAETLGMPRGIFRGILTLSLLYVAILFEVMNIRLGRDEGNIREFMIAFQMMIAFYFGSKVLHHYASTDSKKAIAKAESNVAIASAATHTTPTSNITTTSTTTVNPQSGPITNTEEAVG
jgi:hypothetical protein